MQLKEKVIKDIRKDINKLIKDIKKFDSNCFREGQIDALLQARDLIK